MFLWRLEVHLESCGVGVTGSSERLDVGVGSFAEQYFLALTVEPSLKLHELVSRHNAGPRVSAVASISHHVSVAPLICGTLFKPLELTAWRISFFSFSTLVLHWRLPQELLWMIAKQ